MRNAGLEETQAGIKTAGRNINTSDMQMTPPLWQRGTQEPLDEVKEESKKVGLKLSIQKAKIMASGPITSWQTDKEKMEIEIGFMFLSSKITRLLLQP